MVNFAGLRFVLFALMCSNKLDALRDCSEHYNAGSNIDGVYEIQPTGALAPFKVYCEMISGAWTRIQRREDGHVNFFRNYADYQAGFGVPTEEHWLGNDQIHALTNQSHYKLCIDFLLDNGTELYAEYSSFSINSVNDGYRLQASGFTGTVKKDSLNIHIGKVFSTYDKDSTQTCANHYHGAWWYSGCHSSNLNGQYRYNRTCNIQTPSVPGAACISWEGLYSSGYNHPIRKVTMKIREFNFTSSPQQEMSDPRIQITLDGDFISYNNETIPSGCAEEYAISLRQKTLAMEDTITAMLGNELCASISNIVFSHVDTVITVESFQGKAIINYLFQGSKNLTLVNHEYCSNAVGRHLQDHSNWDQPLIDIVPGCPVASFTKKSFGKENMDWIV